MHSYVARDFAVRRSFYNILLSTCIIWSVRLSIEIPNNVHVMTGFRRVLFCCYVVTEMRPISVEIGDLLTKIAYDIYTDNELALHAILREYRENG